MTCAEVLEAGAGQRRPISLAEVNEEAALQRRVDKKFLLTSNELATLMAALDDDFAIMEIGQRRIFGYSSTYFDTPDLDQFRAHRQGRRRRFKVRTRTYLDSGLCMFEAKLKGLRGETDKYRIPHPLDERTTMNHDDEAFLAELLETEYGIPMPALNPVMTVDYRRGTLVNPHSRERLTCDVQLVCKDQDQEVAGPDLVVVETKSADGRGVADRVLAEMGIRDLSMSKYCVGIALLHPNLPANRWNRILRNRFDWDRAPAFTN
ncbi:polyphosphate polymerase domain-containing protein [Arthrobacter psychrochitiniphilus]|uniref:polyphosphate polymerase domain-containing protein n=1 Tax=Arthrobacter psychrochitiniphilus TaxID=291045 RepID=UPI003F7BA8CB